MSVSSVSPASDDLGNTIGSNAVNDGTTPSANDSISTAGSDPYGTLLQAFGMPNADKDANKAVLQAVVAQNKNLAQNSATVAQINETNNQAGQSTIAATQQAGEDDKIVVAAKQLADMKAQQASLDFATHIGANPDSATYIMNAKADELRQAMADASQKTQDLQSNMSTSFFDNPGKWLTNVFTQGGQIRDADIANARVKQVQSELSGVQQLTQEAVKTNAAIEQTTTAATMAATLDHISQATKIQANTQLMQLGQVNIAGLEKLNSMGEAQLNNLRTASAQKSQMIADAQAQQMMALRIESAKREVIQFNQQQDDRLADVAATTAYGQKLVSGAASLGIKDLPITTDPRMAVKLASLMPKEMRDSIYQQGVANGNLPPGTSFISNNPADVAKILATTNAPLTANDAGIKSLYSGTFQQASQGGMFPGSTTNAINTKDLDNVSAAAGLMAKGKALSMQKDVMVGGKDNIYAPNSYEALLKSAPELTKTPFYQNVLKPQLTAGGLKDFDAAQLIGLAASAVNKSTNPADYNATVNSVAAIFNAQTSLNNNLHSYNTKGLPMQNGFSTALPGAYFGTNNYDLTKADQVGIAMTKSMTGASQLAIDNYGQSVSPMTGQIMKAPQTQAPSLVKPKSYLDKFQDFYGFGNNPSNTTGGNQ